jgi:hypothetical protein
MSEGSSDPTPEEIEAVAFVIASMTTLCTDSAEDVAEAVIAAFQEVRRHA